MRSSYTDDETPEIAPRPVAERGAGLAEYALLLLLIAIVCVGALTILGTTLSGTFNNIQATLFN